MEQRQTVETPKQMKAPQPRQEGKRPKYQSQRCRPSKESQTRTRPSKSVQRVWRHFHRRRAGSHRAWAEEETTQFDMHSLAWRWRMGAVPRAIRNLREGLFLALLTSIWQSGLLSFEPTVLNSSVFDILPTPKLSGSFTSFKSQSDVTSTESPWPSEMTSLPTLLDFSSLIFTR